MPGFNRTGPLGEGPMTGRKQGRCNPNNRKNVSDAREKQLTGRGPGKGRMRGRGKGMCQARGKNRRFGR